MTKTDPYTDWIAALDERQLKEFERTHQVTIQGSHGHTYRIDNRGFLFVRSPIYEDYAGICISISPRTLLEHRYTQMIAFKVTLEADERLLWKAKWRFEGWARETAHSYGITFRSAPRNAGRSQGA